MTLSLLPYFASLHIAVFLFGAAGVLGKLIAISPLLLVVGRTFFATLSLSPIVFGKKNGTSHQLLPKHIWLTGGLLALHWVSFFAAVQSASVAIGLMGFASFPLFVAFLEPWIFKEKRFRSDLIAAVAVIIGMFFMLQGAEWDAHSLAGLLWGILSGLTFALLVIANRWFGETHDAQLLAWQQNLIACLVLLPFIDYPVSLTSKEWLLLAGLGVIFTALSHCLFLYSLKKISARLASLTAMLEPVYGILLAWLLLKESLPLMTMIGAAIILLTTSIATFCKTLDKKAAN